MREVNPAWDEGRHVPSHQQFPFVAVWAVSTRRLLSAEGSHVTKATSHTGSTTRTFSTARLGRRARLGARLSWGRTNGRFVFGARGYRDSMEEQQLGAIRTCGSTVGFLGHGRADRRRWETLWTDE